MCKNIQLTSFRFQNRRESESLLTDITFYTFFPKSIHNFINCTGAVKHDEGPFKTFKENSNFLMKSILMNLKESAFFNIYQQTCMFDVMKR